MQIISAEATTIDIRLTESLNTGAGGVGDRGGLQVRIKTDGGLLGRGETAPIPGVDGPGLESIAVEVDGWCADAPGKTAEELIGTLDSATLTPLARFGVHTALIDLEAQQAGVPVSQWLRAGAPGSVPANGLVAEANPGAVHTHAAELVSAGMPAIKLKVGVVESAQDVTRIIAASEAAGPDIALRLDANGAWDRETAERVIGRVGRHRIDFIEDPTSNVGEYVGIQTATGVPVALDLPITDTPIDVLEQAGVSIAVVKPAAIGGIDRVIDLARASPELRIVVSSSIDREIGLAAAIHAAAGLPDDDEAHGLSTGSLVRNMPDGLLPHGGVVTVPTGSGVWSGDETDV